MRIGNASVVVLSLAALAAAARLVRSTTPAAPAAYPVDDDDSGPESRLGPAPTLSASRAREERQRARQELEADDGAHTPARGAGVRSLDSRHPVPRGEKQPPDDNCADHRTSDLRILA